MPGVVGFFKSGERFGSDFTLCLGKDALRITAVPPPMNDPAQRQALLVGELVYGLAELARELVVASLARLPKARGRRRGGTVRPGPSTPLWNALAASVRPHLRRRGAKSNLGRMLGVSPQKIYQYFKANSAAPDAERVLQLVVWLSQGAPKLVGPAGRKPWRIRPTKRPVI